MAGAPRDFMDEQSRRFIEDSDRIEAEERAARAKKLGIEPLTCLGIGRDADNAQSVSVCFSRPLTDAEFRFFHDMCRGSVSIIAGATSPSEPN